MILLFGDFTQVIIAHLMQQVAIQINAVRLLSKSKSE